MRIALSLDVLVMVTPLQNKRFLNKVLKEDEKFDYAKFQDILKIEMINLLISDFDGVFTDNAVYINENGLESVKCCRADGIGIAKLLNFGIDFIVCSSEKVDCVTHRAKNWF